MESDQSYTKELQRLLISLTNDVTEVAHRTHEVEKAVRRNSYRKSQILTEEAQEIFGIEEASVKDLIEFWMPLWKDEKRISHNGRRIRLGEEARLLGEAPETTLDVYELCKRLSLLFI